MSIFHDEIEIEDFEFDEEEGVYHYPCPCGDRFEITKVCNLLVGFYRLEFYFSNFRKNF